MLNKIKKIHSLYWLYMLGIVLLIVLGISLPVFTVLAFCVSTMYLLKKNCSQGFETMFFLLPYANIFKISANSSSLYTYLILLFVLKIFVHLKKIDKKFLLIWSGLFLLQILGCKLNYSVLIKQAVIPFLLYGYFYLNTKGIKNITISFMMGIISSCMIAKCSEFIPGLYSYMRIVRAYEINTSTYRFTGLYTDPNYLTESIILVFIVSLMLIVDKKITKAGYIGCAFLIYFGMSTISKSFFLMLGIVTVLYLRYLIRKKNYFGICFVIFAIVVVLILVLNGKISIFNDFITRLLYSNDITTGRSDIWKTYIEYIMNNPLNLLVGFGIGASYLEYLPHNTYIDFIYHYGMVGTFLFSCLIKKALKYKISVKDMIFCETTICFGILSFFLSSLMMYDFGFMLIFVFGYLIEMKKERGI